MTTFTEGKPRLIVSFDFPPPTAEQAGDPQKLCAAVEEVRARAAILADALRGLPIMLKGNAFFDIFGTAAIRSDNPAVADLDMFGDEKVGDIDGTMRNRVGWIAALLRPEIITVKTDAGREGLRAAVEAAHICCPSTAVTAVGILTSIDDDTAKRLYNGLTAAEAQLAHLKEAYDAGIRTVVAAVPDVERLKATPWGQELSFVIPGIRRAGIVVQREDQVRKGTPREAILLGGLSTRLVVGRPITQAEDPRAETIATLEEMDAAYEEVRNQDS